MAMRILVFGAILLSWVCSEEVKTKNGCNDELYKMCPDKPSVCRNETCKGAAVAGEEFKEAILKQLNDYRKQPSTNGSYGADMMKLEWDDQLEAAARGWAHKTCIDKRPRFDDQPCRRTQNYNSVGQTRYKTNVANYDNETEVARQATQSWYLSHQYITTGNMFPYTLVKPAVEYTQLMWSRTYRVGCAYVKESPTHTWSRVFVFCNYAPMGNKMDIEKGVNVFNPSNELASACRPGSDKGDSGLCELKNETLYRQNVKLDTVPPGEQI